MVHVSLHHQGKAQGQQGGHEDQPVGPHIRGTRPFGADRTLGEYSAFGADTAPDRARRTHGCGGDEGRVACPGAASFAPGTELLIPGAVGFPVAAGATTGPAGAAGGGATAAAGGATGTAWGAVTGTWKAAGAAGTAAGPSALWRPPASEAGGGGEDGRLPVPAAAGRGR
jgi:hypothetical protein